MVTFCELLQHLLGGNVVVKQLATLKDARVTLPAEEDLCGVLLSSYWGPGDDVTRSVSELADSLRDRRISIGWFVITSSEDLVFVNPGETRFDIPVSAKAVLPTVQGWLAAEQ